MIPDFRKSTVKLLAERAGYICSNPDCRIKTVGPNTNPAKSLIIGEAAHIYGARKHSKRYRFEMNDHARAEITNGIWLCRNCHKKIDSDESLYTSDTIFRWRELHEQYVNSQLGNTTEKIIFKEIEENISKYEDLPHIAKRIIKDKPDGWEWRLASELLRHSNEPLFRNISDLREGLYVASQIHINEEDAINWISSKLNESSMFLEPISKLLDKLTNSFGKPGEAGNLDEIIHTCKLLEKNINTVIKFEESIYFAHLPEEYQALQQRIKNNLLSQIEKLKEIPESLDEVVALINQEHEGTEESPLIIQKTITFEMPKNWEVDFSKELKRLSISIHKRPKNSNNFSSGIFSFLIFFIITFYIFS